MFRVGGHWCGYFAYELRDVCKVSCGCVFACVGYKTVITVILLYSMGMSHDDDHAACTGHSHIMSGEWVKGRNPSDLSWSTCSRDDLENFLRWEIVITVIPPLCIIKRHCFTGTRKDLHLWALYKGDFTYGEFVRFFILNRWENGNCTQTRTTGLSELVSVQFQVNSIMVHFQWESSLTLNWPDCRKWAKKFNALWVAGRKWI